MELLELVAYKFSNRGFSTPASATEVKQYRPAV
jgi:hypothetical protein